MPRNNRCVAPSIPFHITQRGVDSEYAELRRCTLLDGPFGGREFVREWERFSAGVGGAAVPRCAEVRNAVGNH